MLRAFRPGHVKARVPERRVTRTKQVGREGVSLDCRLLCGIPVSTEHTLNGPWMDPTDAVRPRTVPENRY